MHQFKFKHMEINNSPSLLNTSSANKGVASSLNALAKSELNYDNVSIEQMRGNPMYSRHDDIDIVGLAQKQIVENSKTIKSNAKRIRSFNDAARKVNIPTNKQK